MPTTVRRRRPALSQPQLLARRNHDWLLDHEVGRPDPVTGEVAPRSIAMIAKLAGVSGQTVRDGIAAARRAKEAVARAERLD